MLLKVFAGLLMGLIAGATAKALTLGGDTDAPGVSYKGYAYTAAVSAIVFVVYTSAAYSIAFGFAAIGELVVGALVAGFLPRSGLFFVANISIVGLIVAWIMAGV